MMIGWENFADAGVASSDSELASLPASNVLTEHLSRKWETAAGVKSAYVAIDMGADHECNVMALLGTNLTESASLRIMAGPSDLNVAVPQPTLNSDAFGGVKATYGASYKAVIDHHLWLNATNGDYASTPDYPLLATIAGEMDVKVKCSLFDWTPAANQTLAAQYDSTANGAWLFRVMTTGLLNLNISDGAAAINVSSTVAVPFDNDVVYWVRVTRRQSDGETKFWYSMDGVTWTQLGATRTLGAGVVMFNATCPMTVGARGAGGATEPAAGRFYRFKLYAVIDGNIVADFDPSLAAAGAASFVAVTGEIWTINTATYAVIRHWDSFAARYWRIDIADASVADNLHVGRLFLGPAWTPEDADGRGALKWDWSVQALDESRVARSKGGQSFPEVLPKTRVLRFDLDFLNEAEMYGNAFRIAYEQGITKDVLAIPDIDSDYVSEQAVFGLVTASQPITNRNVNIFHQRFEIRERL